MKKLSLLSVLAIASTVVFGQAADKSQDETITGTWTFKNNLFISDGIIGEKDIRYSDKWVKVFKDDIYHRDIHRSFKYGGTLSTPTTTPANSWIFSHEWGNSGDFDLGAQTVKMRGAASIKKWQWAIRTDSYGGREILSVNNEGSGRVGINQSNPSEALDVNGNSIIRGRFQIGNSSTTWLRDPISGYSNGMVSNDGAIFVPVNKNHASDLRLYLPDDYNDAFSIWGNTCGGGDCGDLNAASQVVRFEAGGEVNFFGNVGIGTTNPQEKLSVNGTILAKEVKVSTDASDWPDFVFEDSYQLKDLSEVETFIKTNKHLPDIPSAAQMEEQGVNLAEMNKLLLQKVEELTLYQIQKDKEVKKLKEEAERKKAESKVLKEKALMMEVKSKGLEERLKKVETFLNDNYL